MSNQPKMLGERRHAALTPLQRCILRGTDGLSYVSACAAVRFGGELRRDSLRSAMAAVVAQHDALRTSLADDQSSLVFHESVDIPEIRQHVMELPVDQRDQDHQHEQYDQHVMDFLHKEVHTPFTLGQGPLWRAALLALAPESHLLVLSLHPLICDGWSLGIICEDLAAAYADENNVDEPPPLFSSYLTAETRITRGAGAAETGYWPRLFSSPLPSLDLPLDRQRSATANMGLSTVTSRIDVERLHELKSVSARCGATLFTVLAAGWAATVARLANENELVLALPAAGQLDDGLERMVGQCTRWLPVRLAVDGTLSGKTMLEGAQAQILDAFDHQTDGRDEAVASLGVLGTSATGAMRVGFNLDPDPNNAHTSFAGLRSDIHAMAGVSLPLELFLNTTISGNGIRLDCRFDANLFNASTIERWLELYRALLARLSINSESTIAELAVPPEDEIARISQWNNTQVSYPPVACIQQMFEAQALATPEAIAVSFLGRTLTYSALNQRANRLAHYLRGIGVVPNARVAICMDRSLDMVIAVVAVLKAGAAYLPLDPAYPADRLAHMLEDGQPSALLTQRNLSTLLKDVIPASMPVLDMHEDLQRWETLPGSNPSVANFGLTGESLAYVIYTSGSTGMPKGVAMPHRALVNLLHWQLAEPGFLKLKRTLQFAALGFDVAFQETFSTLCSGGELVLIDEEVRFSPADLFRLVIAEKIERIFLPFVALQLLADGFAMVRDALQPGEQFECALKEVITAGEQVRIEPRITEMFSNLPGCKLINHYGPTESHVVTRYELDPDVRAWPALPAIGKPIANTCIYILDAGLKPLPIGVPGELFIGGVCLASGYLNRDQLTAERFVPDPFSAAAGARMYRTGDLARWRADGNIEYIGRNDFQVKIRGFRVELGEIEARLSAHPAIRDVAVTAREDQPGVKRLVAYYSTREKQFHLGGEEIRAYLTPMLPDYMVPSVFVELDAMPVTPNGKLDRRALPAPGTARPEMSTPFVVPSGPFEIACASAFAAILGLDEVGRNDNFFELGGSSILAVRLLDVIRKETGSELSPPTLFAHPTPGGLASRIEEQQSADSAANSFRAWELDTVDAPAVGNVPIAIIGMAGRFPGANSIEALWHLLLAGGEGITKFSEEQLDPSVSAEMRADSTYVAARGIIDGIEEFDAGFFGMTVREAEVTDPQHRIFLEIAWECLERAGYAPDCTPKPVGVFAGCNTPSYFRNHVLAHPEAISRIGDFQVMIGNDKDYLASRVAYKLNLKGPAVAVNTACSTSLVAISQAVDSLRFGRCAMALAGGASVTAPCRTGYTYQEGAMLSADGSTRSFDRDATGTVFNDGAAVVLLKRLDAAIADGDQIYAVIKGVATNNDGGGKASFTAPSVDGQAAVIAAAHRDATVDPRTITYVEAHGTATPLGDPIEIEALATAFRRDLPKSDWQMGYCRIGSVKSNIGHLISAAGATGVIKTALSLHTQILPASIHFKSPNPNIALATSPFVVNTSLHEWQRGETPRRAGVSSFGVGGTNAHVVLEEAPPLQGSSFLTGPHILRLSAKSQNALATMAADLSRHLSANPGTNLADAAYTLDVGRSRFAHRLAVATVDIPSAVAALSTRDSLYRSQRELASRVPQLVFVFPGQGAHYPAMGRALYEADQAFRVAFDECLVAVAGHCRIDLRSAIFKGHDESLDATEITQPAMFCLEYAVSQMWLARGIRPALLIGHSVGEFVAAVLAGVMSLQDAIRLVAKRGAAMQSLPGGTMLSVRMPAEKLEALLPPDLSLAAENGPSACVIAGPTQSIENFSGSLSAAGVTVRPLRTSHAFHSAMMTPAVAPFRELVASISLSAPKIPIISTRTGKVLLGSEAVYPDYWAGHLRDPVRFSPAIHTAIGLGKNDPSHIAFLEVGPRGTLSTLIRQHNSPGKPAPTAVASLAEAADLELLAFATAEGHLWTMGIDVLAHKNAPTQKRQRILLPTYPFERQRAWLDAVPAANLAQSFQTPHLHSNTTQIPTFPAESTTMSTTVSRRPRLIDEVRTLFEDVAGTDLSGSAPSTTFIELGLDSLTLTQAAIQLKKNFAVKITFRQLMESYRSFESLATYLDETLPAELAQPTQVMATQLGPAAALPVSSPALGTPLMQQVIQQQMQLMAQQLALLGGAAVQAPVSAPLSAQTPAPRQSSTGPDPEMVKAVSYDVKKAFGAIARIHTQGSALTDRQKVRLDAFVRRYTDRTAKSKAYTAQHRPHLADPRVVNNFRPATKEITYQIVVEKSKGARLWDIDGNEYIDALNGFGMSLFGWQPDFVQDVIKKQLETGYDIGPMHPLAGDVAKLVCELTGFDRAGLCNTGSEAVMAAIRIARTVTGRSLMVVFSGSYHGTFDEVIVRAGRNYKGIPAAPGIMSEAFGNILVLDYGTPETLEIIRQHADELAAVLVEPVQSRRPDFQPIEFLKQLRKITEDSGTCLIFDEVITGFRAHPGGTQALFGIKADLATYGKVIGGGYPIGVVAGKREYMDALDGGSWQFGDESIPTVGVTYFAGTFVRHPLALAAAKASLEHMKKLGPVLQEELNGRTAGMAAELNAYFEQCGAPISIKHFASLWRTSFLEDHPLQDLVFAMMRSRGIHILDNFPCFFTTAHTAEDIALMVKAYKESVAELQDADLLPRKPAKVLAFDANSPPMPGARIGKDEDGKSAWFVPNPDVPGKYLRLDA